MPAFLDSATLAATAAEVWSAVAPALLVAMLRVVDVTLNVFRTVFTVNGKKSLAASFHALEGGTYLAAAGIVLADVTVARAVGYMVGILLGTVLGMRIIERLRLGMVTVRVYADARHADGFGRAIAENIRTAGFGATMFDGEGYKGPVKMILSTVPRRKVDRVVAAVREIDEDVFLSVDNDLQPMTQTARA